MIELPEFFIEKVRLKDEDGNIITVTKNSCYDENKKGNIVCALGGFNYFIGKRTDEKVNSIVVGNGSIAGNKVQRVGGGFGVCPECEGTGLPEKVNRYFGVVRCICGTCKGKKIVKLP